MTSRCTASSSDTRVRMAVLLLTILLTTPLVAVAPGLKKKTFVTGPGVPPDQLAASDQLVLTLLVASAPVQLMTWAGSRPAVSPRVAVKARVRKVRPRAGGTQWLIG